MTDVPISSDAEIRPTDERLKASPDQEKRRTGDGRSHRRRILKRVGLGVLGFLAFAAGGLFFLWQWVLSDANTNMTPPSDSSFHSDTSSLISSLESSEETSGEESSLPGDTTETTEGTITDLPTTPDNTDYLEGIHYDKKLTNILLIGTDSRDPSGRTYERSDTMMLLTVDQENDSVKLTSFQRDMLVYMPGQSVPDKLNAANEKGPDYLVETINRNFLLDIEDYIMVNIMDAENLIDAIGGLNIYVPDDPDVLGYLNACIIEQNVMYEGWEDRTNWVPVIEKGGLLHLNGRQTIAYARMRKLDSDYERMARQRDVLAKAYAKAKQSNPLQLLRLAKAGFGMINTNMSRSQLTAMAISLIPVMNADIEQMQIPVPGYFWYDDTGTWVIRANFNAMIPPLHRFIYSEDVESFIPVPLVPYTPLEKINPAFDRMPDGVFDGSFRDIRYVGRYGWSGDGSPVYVDGSSVSLPPITPDAQPSDLFPSPTPRSAGTGSVPAPTPVPSLPPSVSVPSSSAAAPELPVPTAVPSASQPVTDPAIPEETETSVKPGTSEPGGSLPAETTAQTAETSAEIKEPAA